MVKKLSREDYRVFVTEAFEAVIRKSGVFNSSDSLIKAMQETYPEDQIKQACLSEALFTYFETPEAMEKFGKRLVTTSMLFRAIEERKHDK
jgi:hypothetical protein